MILNNNVTLQNINFYGGNDAVNDGGDILNDGGDILNDSGIDVVGSSPSRPGSRRTRSCCD